MLEVLRKRRAEEIALAKRKRDEEESVDIIPSENNNYSGMNKKMTKLEKKKAYLDEISMVSRAKTWMDKMLNSYQSEDFVTAMELYREDVERSDGFDVRHKPPRVPGASGGHNICRIYDPPNIVPNFYIVNALRCLSNLAISVYNRKKGTNYENVRVMMAMSYGCRDEYYNITFKASVPFENAVTFQTKVCLILNRPYHIAVIEFVRELNGENHEKEFDVFDKDSEKLPLYLSEFSLEEYNLHKLACSGFTMKEDEMYGGVNVLRWRRKIISKYEGSIYSIKFEGSLPKSTIVKIFRTKLHVSFFGSAAKLEVKYVKSKCSTN